MWVWGKIRPGFAAPALQLASRTAHAQAHYLVKASLRFHEGIANNGFDEFFGVGIFDAFCLRAGSSIWNGDTRRG